MMFQGHRSNDAVVTVCQDNAKHLVEIRGLNPPAEEVLGYRAGSVIGKALTDFLPSRIRTLLEEYVEFEDDGNDVGAVLGKVQSFCLIDNKGREHAFRLKVLRSESLDKNAYFRLILQGKAASAQSEAFRTVLYDNFKGHEVLEPNTNLPDRNSTAKDLELVTYYAHKDALKACFAVLELDGYDAVKEKHGDAACYGMLKQVAYLARQNLRPDDTIGCISQRAIGVILMDTNFESARIALNRLRWLIAAAPHKGTEKEALPITVSIAFAQVGEGSVKDTKELIPAIETRLKERGERTGNVMLEIS